MPKDLIRHVVITVDNLPRKSMRPQMWPVRPAAGTFIATEGAIAPANAERYTPMVRALEAADPIQSNVLGWLFGELKPPT